MAPLVVHASDDLGHELMARVGLRALVAHLGDHVKALRSGALALAGVALLWMTMWKLELTSKNASFKLGRLRRKLELDAIERSAGETKEPALTP